jgi:hypothetical protein
MRHAYDAGRQPIFHCTKCEDTGFDRGPRQSQGLECPGDGRCQLGHCGQEGASGYAHTYTRPCFCRGSNPFLVDERNYINARRKQQPEKART